MMNTEREGIMIKIDGSLGEGGGQILRTALGLSLVTGRPFSIENIRAKRIKPGLMRQHLTALNAAVKIGNGRVEGNFAGSKAFRFEPGRIDQGDYSFAVGTAGSACLVLQTILPALITGEKRSEIVIEGGTHNPFAPPFDFLKKGFFPILEKMGVKIDAEIEKPGFYPAGGGKFSIGIDPVSKLKRIDLSDRGGLVEKRAFAMVSNIPENIGKRELKVVRGKIGVEGELIIVTNSPGPGNTISIETEYENITEVFTGFGEKGVSAEKVASNACKLALTHMASKACTGRFLADQILVPMAIAGGGKFTTIKPSLHTITNIEIIKKFLDIGIGISQKNESIYEIEVGYHG